MKGYDMKTKDNSKQRPQDAIDPKESDGGIGRDAVLGMNAKLRGLRDDWYHIDVALWHYIVHVYIGSRQMMISTMQCENCVTDDGRTYDMESVCKSFCDKYSDYFSSEPKSGESKDVGNHVFVRLDNFSFDINDILIAMHECLHAANIVLRGVNLIGDGNVEGLAYTQEYIYGEFMRQYMSRHTPQFCGSGK